MPESFLLVALRAGFEMCLLLTSICERKTTENPLNGTFPLGCIFQEQQKQTFNRHNFPKSFAQGMQMMRHKPAGVVLF